MAMQLDGSTLVTVSIEPNWVVPAETAGSRRSAGPVQNGPPAFVCREQFTESRRAVPKRRIPLLFAG